MLYDILPVKIDDEKRNNAYYRKLLKNIYAAIKKNNCEFLPYGDGAHKKDDTPCSGNG